MRLQWSNILRTVPLPDPFLVIAVLVSFARPMNFQAGNHVSNDFMHVGLGSDLCCFRQLSAFLVT